MRRRQFEFAKGLLATGTLVVALFFQMLPFFFLMLVLAYNLGVTSGGLLVIVPVFFLVMVFAACWLASKRTRRAPAQGPVRAPPRPRRTTSKPMQDNVALLKTRVERYQDIKNILGGMWQ